jgi:hypothetical protein
MELRKKNDNCSIGDSGHRREWSFRFPLVHNCKILWTSKDHVSDKMQEAIKDKGFVSKKLGIR